MLDDLINSLDNSLDHKPLTISKQINMLRNNISSLRNSASGLEKDKGFSDERL